MESSSGRREQPVDVTRKDGSVIGNREAEAFQFVGSDRDRDRFKVVLEQNGFLIHTEKLEDEDSRFIFHDPRFQSATLIYQRGDRVRILSRASMALRGREGTVDQVVDRRVLVRLDGHEHDWALDLEDVCRVPVTR